MTTQQVCTYPRCKCIVSTSTSQPEPTCPLGLEKQPARNFDDSLASFVEGCKRIANDYRAKHFPSLQAVNFDIMRGGRYIRVVREDGQRSVHCFVDTTTGDVLKAAGWKAPAKHARGNIFDESNGLKLMGQYGPAYLR